MSRHTDLPEHDDLRGRISDMHEWADMYGITTYLQRRNNLSRGKHMRWSTDM